MSTAQSLKSLKQEFTLWRMQKKSVRSHVPVKLRRKVLALRPHIDDTTLLSTLNIRPIMLESWSKKQKKTPQEINAPVEFVSLPSEVIHNSLETTAITEQATGVQLSCNTPNGNHWCLQGDVNPQQLSAFVQAIGVISGGVK